MGTFPVEERGFSLHGVNNDRCRNKEREMDKKVKLTATVHGAG